MKPSPYHGLLVVDKPGGITSRDAVDRAQRWFPRGTRLGHTGTLDPLATGVLVLGVGAATRLTEYVQRMEKVYLTTIALDRRSDTDDLDGTVEQLTFDGPPPDRAAVGRCLQTFLGEVEQVPPAFSAAKVSGRRAYALARRGEKVSLAPRRVRIYQIDLLSYEYPLLKLQVRCGKGTYIRSLARDIGQRLGRAGTVMELRRTRIGPFDEAQALRLEADPSAARA
ncbi:MAG TPA: tRNA pseudouridine(55) synthase TruB, partial [Gemmataceae bacterium]|nr:tRNA pseudouridine(55) synthase TruB [Gemmataceae bacterium]